MIVEFGEEYLRDLYTKGECGDKRRRYRIDVVKRYKRGIDYLKWASRKEDLFRINSLNFEALKGGIKSDGSQSGLTTGTALSSLCGKRSKSLF